MLGNTNFQHMLFFPLILVCHSFLFLCFLPLFVFPVTYSMAFSVSTTQDTDTEHTQVQIQVFQSERNVCSAHSVTVFSTQCDSSMWLLCPAGDNYGKLISSLWVWSGSLALDAGSGVLHMWQGVGQGNGMPWNPSYEVSGSITSLCLKTGWKYTGLRSHRWQGQRAFEPIER